ncbi:MAG: SHOCT domain-containing protein [Alkalibacterium sp.]|nr:SHOCT domain-containing protein [Alkalibacterium sp.]
MIVTNSNHRHTTHSSHAVDILKERYARGEISEEEYRDKLNKLKD